MQAPKKSTASVHLTGNSREDEIVNPTAKTALTEDVLLTSLLKTAPKDEKGKIKGTFIPYKEIENLSCDDKEILLRAIETISAVTNAVISSAESNRQLTYSMCQSILEEAYGSILVVAYLTEIIHIDELPTSEKSAYSVCQLIDDLSVIVTEDLNLAEIVIKILSKKKELNKNEQRYLLLAHLATACRRALDLAEQLEKQYAPVETNVRETRENVTQVNL